MEHARGEALWLVLDHAHVPALGSEADPFDYGGQDRLALDEPNTALPTAGRQAVDVWERRGQCPCRKDRPPSRDVPRRGVWASEFEKPWE